MSPTLWSPLVWSPALWSPLVWSPALWSPPVRSPPVRSRTLRSRPAVSPSRRSSGEWALRSELSRFATGSGWSDVGWWGACCCGGVGRWVQPVCAVGGAAGDLPVVGVEFHVVEPAQWDCVAEGGVGAVECVEVVHFGHESGRGQSGQAHPFHCAAIAIRCRGLWSRWVLPASMAVVPEKTIGQGSRCADVPFGGLCADESGLTLDVGGAGVAASASASVGAGATSATSSTSASPSTSASRPAPAPAAPLAPAPAPAQTGPAPAPAAAHERQRRRQQQQHQ